MFVGESDQNSKGKITLAEVALQRFGLKPSNRTNFKAPWQLSTNDLKVANERLKGLHIPTHYDLKPCFLFTHPSRLKSHDWKQVI